MGDADPTRIVADADVLAADLLCGGRARDAVDIVRAHSWLTLVASDALLDDAHAIVADLADEALAEDWRERVERERERVEHPEGDHSGLASAYRGRAAHLLTFEETLASASAQVSLRPHLAVSVRTPDAFARLFDAEALYEATHDGTYPGPDIDPRS